MIELANGVSLPEGAVVQSIVCHMGNAREYSAIVKRIQYDKTLPVIEVTLQNNGNPYEVPENATVSIRLRKGDGKGVYNPALGLSEDRTKAYITVTQQMTVVPGDCRAVVEVAAGGGVICASEFFLKVTENPVQEGAIESEDEYLTITEILAQVQQMHSDVEGWKEQTLNYKKQAENMAINAVSSASSAADSATSAASSATQAGTSATNAATSAAQAEEASEHYPTISSDGYWQLWDPASGKYVKTTQKAQGPEGPTGPPVDTSTLISQAEKGVSNGVATLDSSVKIPVSQIPSLDYIPTTQKGAASGVATLDTTGKIPVGQYCEEGTWTPVLDISGGPNISYTIAANRGCKYWTIGDLVYITCYLRVDITSAGSGSTGDRSYASIGGLPFVASSESKYPVTISELYGCVSNKWDKGFINESYVYFVKDDGAANEWWLASEFAGINFCGWYKKAT